MTAPAETWHFDTRHVGRDVLVYDSLPSTNDRAAATDVPAGTLVVARHQTAGRGQHGRVWQSRSGLSLLTSVRLHPPPALDRPVILTAWAAVAVADAVAELTHHQPRIKWPNDLLVDGKKVCGILIERKQATVVGIGLNLNQTPADFADLPDATSLNLLAGRPFDLRAVCEGVVRQLDAGYDRLLADDRDSLEADWKARLGLVGRHVRVEAADGETVDGRLLDLSFDGLELDQGDGAVRVLTPEFVRHVAPA